jgi:lysophospholipid acyltransferase (LPLAT)-like uncharacterized protein
MNTTYTRQQYLNKECTHSQYYSQFVNKGVIQRVQRFSEKDLMEGKNQDFNNIPLQWWDKVMIPVPFEIVQKMKELGDYPTPAGVVCILKEAAKQIVDQYQMA